MTISVVYEPDVYTGNGVLATYPITFAFLGVSANIKVSLKSSIDNIVVEKTATTHYNVVGTNVVFETAYIPISTDTVIIELDPDYLQSSDYVENSNFSAETLERDFDKLKLEVQLLRDTGRRAIRVDSSVDLNITDPNSTFQSDVGLEIGVDVQAYNANLTTLGSAFTSASTSTASSLKLYEDVDNGTNYAELKAPASIASNYTLTLPADDGTSNQLLSTNGSGTLSWVTPATQGTDTISLTEGIILGSTGHTGYVKLLDTVDGTKYVQLKGFDNLTNSYSLQFPANVGTPGYVLSTDGTAGNLQWVNNSTTALPAGSSTQVQWNNAGALAADSGFTYTTGNSVAITGDLLLAGRNTFPASVKFWDIGAAKSCVLKSADANSANITFTLPSALPTVTGQVMSCSDAGIMGWSTATYNLNSAWTAANTTVGASLKFNEGTNNGTNFVAIKGGDTLAGDTTYTLPTAYGTTGYVLASTDAGVMSWVNKQTYSAVLTNLQSVYANCTTTVGAQLDLYEGTNNGTNHITLNAPAILGGDYTFTLPNGNGTSGFVLQTDGSGVTSWVSDVIKAAADQTAQEAATSNTVAVTPGTQKYHPSAAKAWFHADDMSTTPAYGQSYNCGAITDNGVGDWSIAFTVSFSASEFCTVATARAAASPLMAGTVCVDAGNIRILVEQSSGGTDVDAAELNVACFGDQ